MKIVFWPALTPALSPRRGRIARGVLSNRRPFVIRALPPASHQGTATNKLTVELLNVRDNCFLSPGERAGVRASVTLTLLSSDNPRPRVVRQRVRRAFLQRVENHVSNELFLPPQLPVPETQFLDAHRSEKFCSLRIVSSLSRMPMLSTVKLDGEARFHTIEVEVVNSARVIASEFVRTETAIPQPTPHKLFCPSLLLSQSAGAFGIAHERKLERCGHFEKIGFTTALTPALSPRRGRIVRSRSLYRRALDFPAVSLHNSNSKAGGAA